MQIFLTKIVSFTIITFYDYTFKFILVAALFAVAAANDAYNKPVYEASTYATPAYEKEYVSLI